jgi:cytochrome P450
MSPTLPAATPARVRPLSSLPGPPALPLLGHLLQLDTPRMHQQLEAWCRRFGPLYRLRLGATPVLVCADHPAIAACLRDRPDGFRRTTRMTDIASEIGLPAGVFSAQGESWKRQRRMVMAGFDPAHVRRYHPALVRVAHRLAQRWRQRAGQPLDLQAELTRYTVDVTAGLAFGSDVDTLSADDDVIQRHLDRVFPALFSRMLSPLPTWRWWRSEAVRELEHSMAALNESVRGFVAAARERLDADAERRAHPQNLLEAMIVAADEPGSGIDDTQVAGNVFTLLLAGEDTTANTLAWTLDLLWRHPAALQAAIDEVRAVCGGAEAPTPEQLAQLVYVEACLHETLRLKPVAPLIALEALRDSVVGGVRVARGNVVLHLMRHDATSDAHVPDAARFEPARWRPEGTPGALPAAARRTAMPFGAGPRICPGRHLALVEMKLALATLLGAFDIEALGPAHGGPTEERLSFTMAPVGLTMRLRERR